MNPKVSILMGVYNCEETLEESIESIINQTYKNLELIICDDCSTDKSLEIAIKYSKLYPKNVIVMRNKKNLTLGPTLNRCLKLARGKYIGRQDGDDTCDKCKVATQVKFMKDNPNIDLVGTAMKCFDHKGVYGTRVLKKNPKEEDLMRGTTFCHGTIIIKSEVMRALNGYSESPDAKGVEDYDLWFRFFHGGYIGYNLQEPLYSVREDRNCYKRKNYKRRVNEIKTMYKGRKLLGLGIGTNKYLLKPMLAAIMPRRLLIGYHRYKVK